MRQNVCYAKNEYIRQKVFYAKKFFYAKQFFYAKKFFTLKRFLRQKVFYAKFIWRQNNFQRDISIWRRIQKCRFSKKSSILKNSLPSWDILNFII